MGSRVGAGKGEELGYLDRKKPFLRHTLSVGMKKVG
jgi:hypothetical protein